MKIFCAKCKYFKKRVDIISMEPIDFVVLYECGSPKNRVIRKYDDFEEECVVIEKSDPRKINKKNNCKLFVNKSKKEVQNERVE